MKYHYFNAEVTFRAHICVSDDSGMMTKEVAERFAKEILDNGDYELGDWLSQTDVEYVETEEE